MPRTKRTSKSTKRKVSDNVNIHKLTHNKEIDNYVRELDRNYKKLVRYEDDLRDNLLQELKMMHRQCNMLVPSEVGKTAIADLSKCSNSTHFITVSDTISCNNILEVTSAIKTAKAKKYKRSVSLADDEGYLTSENSENSGGTRRSRAKNGSTMKSKRQSRSLSRKKMQPTQSVFDSYTTPANKKQNNDFGFVTPKVKPNTPQVILRRPKEGEMAISMQGSPLLVNALISRDANVNIPLEDGRTFSIQPQLGIRMSQIPNIDTSIRRQIEVLRDNLIKVCSLTSGESANQTKS